MSQTLLHARLPFPFDSPFVRLYFGRNGERAVSFPEFAQFLHDFHEEYAAVAFRARDKEQNGFITRSDLLDIMRAVKGHLMTPKVSDFTPKKHHVIDFFR